MEAGASTQEAKVVGDKAQASVDEDLSMEEILQSIRRIITEDEKDAKKSPADAKKAKNKDDDVPGSDVFELTDMVKDDGTVVNLKTETQESDVLGKIDEALAAEKKEELKVEPAPAASSQNDIDAMFAAPAAPEPPPPPPPAPVVEDDSLLSQTAAAASMAAFDKLKSTEQYAPSASVTPAPSFRDGTTMEDLVTEMLRPMMKVWLDANLPQIVERIVEREVRKLTK